MRSVVFTLAVFYVSSTIADYREEYEGLLKTLHEECKNETNSDDGSFTRMRKTGHVDRTNQNLMNHLVCIAKNTAFIDDEGNINKDICIKHLVKLGFAEDKASNIIEQCASIKNSKKFENLGLLISDYYECYQKILPMNYSNI